MLREERGGDKGTANAPSKVGRHRRRAAIIKPLLPLPPLLLPR